MRPADVDAGDQVWRAQLDEFIESVRRWTGNHAGIVEISESELPRLRADWPPALQEVGVDAIDLAGEPARQILAEG